jgi:Tfp pilus assembly protein PilF
VTALILSACVLPFALITRSIQDVMPAGISLWWQRPFVAGDALAFYLFKIAVPVNLCVDYGRTPHAATSHAWGYLAWVVPVGLLALGWINRRRRPVAWLGALLFVAFLLPVLGLVPFKFQAYSTVADRYVYLPMIGIGLIVADAVAAIRSSVAGRAALAAVSAAVIALAVLSFNQSGHWIGNGEFLRHTLDVNPDVGFAHNNLGILLLKQGHADDALGHFGKALELGTDVAKAHNNIGLALVQLGRPAEAEPHYRKAVELDPRYFKAHENLAAIYLQSNRLDAAIASLKAAIDIQPSEANAFNNLGIALMRSNRGTEGLDAFRRAVSIEPNNGQYRRNLAQALVQMGRADEAASYLGH